MGEEFDWRERPMMSPLGGFLIQSRAGESGNYEVVIPWPGGGLAHFARDNDADGFPWHGPTLFGSGEYTGATVIESDFREFRDNRLGNLEVAATRTDGVVDGYWRENGGAFLWKGPFTLPFGSPKAANPAMAYSGAWQVDPPFEVRHGPSSFFLAVPERSRGFAYWIRSNQDNGVSWNNVGGTGNSRLVGIGLAVTTEDGLSSSAGYKYVQSGRRVVAGVTENGQIELFVHHFGSSVPGLGRSWIDRTTFGRDVFPELNGRFAGRPCLVQTDFGYDEPSDISPLFNAGHYGNLELIVPSKQGGLLHFWRDCGEPGDGQFKPIRDGWSGPTTIGTALYDEVSFIQSNFGTGEHGNLELIARRSRQPGFDVYWRDEQLRWHGPMRVGPTQQELVWRHTTPSFGEAKVAAGTGPTSWYTPTENVQHLAYVGEDRQIHECFFFIGGENRWFQGIPSAGQALAAPGTSPTSWYAPPEKSQHIAYVGEDRLIHECFFFIGGDNQWLHNVPGAGKPPVAAGTSPTSWFSTPENVQHIAYVGEDRMIHECFFFLNDIEAGWRHTTPNAGQVPVAPGTSPTSWYTTPENVQHIAYVGEDQMIHECFFFTSDPAAGWRHGVLNAGQVPVAPGTSPTSWYATPDNVQHVAYAGTDGLIHQCFFFIGGFGGWQHEVTNAGQEPVAPGTSPTSWYTPSENSQHIAYLGRDGLVHECFFFVRVGGPHTWAHNVPSAGHVPAALDSRPTSWYTPADNVQHVAYVGAGRQVEECFFFLP